MNIDNDGQTHKVRVKCKESSIVDFGDEKDIGKKLAAEECYEYQILDNAGNLKVTIYKSKSHNQFSMSQLMGVYDNLNKVLVKDCNEIILSNHVLNDSGGFVLESNPHRVHIMGITSEPHMESVLIHEMAHSFDMSNNISGSNDYKELALKHPSKLNPYNENHEKFFVEDFAYSIEDLYSDFLPHVDKTIYLYKLLGIILI
ncbi:MAG: hypothetical protein E7Z80_08895 [Methanobrevibacter thaueri]|nr:hypothetical protein [Methanobrevibacter thaueri]